MNVDFALLECLEAVVTEGSFDKAAGALAITQSAVSQRIRQLEAQVGLPLLFRTRPVRPTPAAQPLLRFARQARLLAQELLPEMHANAVRDQLRLAVNADSLGSWVLPALADWVRAHDTMLEFVVDDQEHTADWLRSGEVVGAIGSVPVAAKGFRSVPLGVMRYHCLASPDFVASYFPRGLNRASVRHAPALVFNRRDALQDEHIGRHLRWRSPQFPRHYIPAYEAYLQAALHGFGYGMLPEPQCREALASGALVDVTPGTVADVPLYWHAWALDSELIGSLTDALRRGAMSNLRQMP
ncbi:MAG: hypothetical protein CGU28_12395 [Candidatus Dactylopiibacterium carminicum]|nr:MAG: hypothetical protein CGU28_12395 [Candidatus Dactylopiibacterium carminicum]